MSVCYNRLFLSQKKLFYHWIFSTFVRLIRDADIATNEIINDTEKVDVKISDGILNSLHVPNFRYIIRNALARINSFGQAKELLSNNMPIDVRVQKRKAHMAKTFKGDICKLYLDKSSNAKTTKTK